MTSVPFTLGLHRLDDQVWAWLQPDGGWGLSNAGLIGGGDRSFLVDTLFDRPRTHAMLRAMRPITDTAPIRDAVNTHGNGDHCFGNELLDPDTLIWAAPEATAHMRAESPALAAGMLAANDDPALSRYLRRAFGGFEFTGITPRLPDRAVTEDRELVFGDASVRLLRAGPAHTAGDVAVHHPGSGVVFTGDLLFVGGTPIMWAGPAASWIAELDRLLELDADTFAPGHGPVTDATGVRDVRDYLEWVETAGTSCHARGLTAAQAASAVDPGPFAALGHPERIVITMDAVYRHLDPTLPAPTLPALFTGMAQWVDRHAR